MSLILMFRRRANYCLSLMVVTVAVKVSRHLTVQCSGRGGANDVWYTVASKTNSNRCRGRRMGRKHSLSRLGSGEPGVPMPPWTCADLLADNLQLVAELPGRRRLRSSSSSALFVPPTRLRTIGDRAFTVAAAKTWNSLPPEVTSPRSTSFSAFKSKLKTYLFSLSFPDLVTVKWLKCILHYPT